MKAWWEKPLAELSSSEWELLCDGCGQCCLLKLQDEDSGDFAYTDLACQLLNLKSCRCRDYPNRRAKVEDCVSLSLEDPSAFAWLPYTCAYRLRYNDLPLPAWHPLLSGNTRSVRAAGISVRGKVISELDVSDKVDLEERVLFWVEAER